MNQLRAGANVITPLIPLAQGDYLFGRYLHVFQQSAAAGRGALAHAVPVIEQGDARCIGREHDVQSGAGLVHGLDFQQVGKQAAGAVELAAVEDQLLATTFETGVDLAAKSAAALGNGAR